MADPTRRRGPPAHPRPDLPQATWDAIKAVVGEVVASSPGSPPGFVAIARACRAARRAGRIPGCSNQQLDAALKHLADAGELGLANDSVPEPVLAPTSDPLRININRFLDVVYDEQAGRARVLVGGKPFLHCSFIVANIDPDESNNRNGSINSIDDLTARPGASDLEGIDVREWLTPAEEVLAHASNLQAWAENGYDTRLLHSNIAFPLLRELTIAGDEKAARVLDSEIGIRIRDGNLNTRAAILDSVITYINDPDLLKILLEDKALIQLDEDKSKLGEVRAAYYITRGLERLVREGNRRAREIRDELLASLLKDSPSIVKAATLETWWELAYDPIILRNLLKELVAPSVYLMLDDEVLVGEILNVFFIQFCIGRVDLIAYCECLDQCLRTRDDVTKSTAYGELIRLIRSSRSSETNQYKALIECLSKYPEAMADLKTALNEFKKK